MGREFIGECPGWRDDPESDDLETKLAIKYIKQARGKPPRGVDVQVTFEGSEVGNEGDEVAYPVISVVWDDGVTEYPGEHIGFSKIRALSWAKIGDAMGLGEGTIRRAAHVN